MNCSLIQFVAKPSIMKYNLPYFLKQGNYSTQTTVTEHTDPNPHPHPHQISGVPCRALPASRRATHMQKLFAPEHNQNKTITRKHVCTLGSTANISTRQLCSPKLYYTTSDSQKLRHSAPLKNPTWLITQFLVHLFAAKQVQGVSLHPEQHRLSMRNNIEKTNLNR